MTQSFAFVQFGSFSHTNEHVLRELRGQFSGLDADVIDAADFRLIRRSNALRLLTNVAGVYGWRGLTTSERFRRHIVRTPYFFRTISERLQRRMSGRRYAFTFQTQALFDASQSDVPHFLYTDHTHMANLHYPGFAVADLYSKAWIEQEERAYRHARMNFTMSTNISRSLVEQYGCVSERVECGC